MGEHHASSHSACSPRHDVTGQLTQGQDACAVESSPLRI